MQSQQVPIGFPLFAKIADILVPFGMGVSITLAFKNGGQSIIGFIISWLFGLLFLYGRWNTR